MGVTPAVAPGFGWHATEIGPVLRCEALESVVDHAFTSRGLRFSGESADADHTRLAALFGVSEDRVLRVRQVHGRAVVVARPGDDLPHGADADAIVSWSRDAVASVRVADCVPVIIADRQRRSVAVVHAGWRGTCVGIVAEAVAAMVDGGVAASDLVAALGPGIGPCCYQVDDRVRTAFLAMTPDAAAWFAEDGPGRWKLDLLTANADQLLDAGLSADAIHVAGLCTADHPDVCFSHRREGGTAGRMVAAARLTG